MSLSKLLDSATWVALEATSRVDAALAHLRPWQVALYTFSATIAVTYLYGQVTHRVRTEMGVLQSM